MRTGGRKPRVVVLGEKPQGCAWLTELLQSGLFEVVAGVPRHSLKNVWWEGEHFASLLAAHSIPVVHRQERLEQVRGALRELGEEASARQVVEHVYTDVDEKLWDAAEWSVQAQLDYLRQ